MKTVTILIMLLVMAPSLVFGATQRATGYVPETPNGWSEIVPITPFNPLQGELVSIHFFVEGQFSALVQHENLNVTGCMFNDDVSWTLSISMNRSAAPDLIMALDDQVDLQGDLDGFDGQADYLGDSGVSHYVATPLSGGVMITGDAMQDFVGTQMLNLHLVSTGNAQLYLTDPSGVSLATTGCTVTIFVDYDFLPAAVDNEQSSWGSLKSLFR